MTQKLRYSSFADDIDIDAFEHAIGFEPLSHHRGNDIGHCLFPEAHKHGDTTAKFAIHREKRVFNCWVCGGGDLLSLTMMLTSLDVEEATEWLFQFAHGEQRNDDEFADYLVAMLEDVEERVETMPYFNAHVLDRFNDPTDYFRSRGISDEVVAEQGLRFCEQAFKMAPIKTGRGGEKIKVDEDYLGPASIWPHYWQGRLVGWQYRWHDWDKEHNAVPRWLPKWTNTTDFPRSTTLYNYDAALKTRGRVILVESLGTVNFLKAHGYPAVGWFGSKPTDAQLRLLRRFSDGVILAPDNDSNLAGDKIFRSVQYLERFIPVYLAEKVQPQDVDAEPDADGLDLGDYVRRHFPALALGEHLSKRVHEATSFDF